MEKVYIGLGSNLLDPIQQLHDAVILITNLIGVTLNAESSLYRSQPMGPQDQPDFYNQVIAIETDIEPLPLLHSLQKIEKKMGRVRTSEQWGPRVIDCDILLYGNQEISLPELTIPHYGATMREFVLYPLAEIAPNLIFPNGQRLKNLLRRCSRNGMVRVQGHPYQIEEVEYE